MRKSSVQACSGGKKITGRNKKKVTAQIHCAVKQKATTVYYRCLALKTIM
jgi:hypothetical protein